MYLPFAYFSVSKHSSSTFRNVFTADVMFRSLLYCFIYVCYTIGL